MSDDHLFQTHLKDIPSPVFRPTYTFNGKNSNKDTLIDFKDTRMTPDSELSMLKEQHRRTLTDLAKVNTHNKELKTEIVQLESKFQLKDKEIIDLKNQLETRGSASRKLQERDSNAQRNASRSPLTESTADMKSTRSSDSVIEKLVGQNKSLKREVEKLTEKLRRFEDSKGKDAYYKVAQDLPNRLKLIESSNESLIKENEELRESMRVLDGEASKLRRENISMKKNYDDLKSRYESLETTATSNKGDYSTESGANSEVGSKVSTQYTKFSMNDMKSELEGMNITWQERSSSKDLGLEEYKKIVEDIMEMYRLKSPAEIVPSIQKTEKVVQMVPKLRKIISEVAVMVFPRAGLAKDKGIEMILPSLKKVCKELDEVDVLNTLRIKLIDVLQLEKDCSNVEIVKRVDKLATLCYQSSETKLQQSTDFRDQPENNLMTTQFNKIFGMQPSVTVFRQISKQVEDFKQFVTVAKHKLKLEAEMKNEACLIHLLKFIEGLNKEKQVVDMIHRLQNAFNCGLDTLAYTLERMIGEKKDKNYNHNGY